MLAYAQSVHELAADQLAEVTTLHNEALITGEVTGRMQALIKNVVENQRSVLDYTAQAIADKYGCGTKPYWFGASKPTEFRRAIQKQLPGILNGHQKIADALERHQPYQPSHGWLPHLFSLTVENKHHRLTPQVSGDEFRPRLLQPAGKSGFTGPVLVRIRWDFEDPPVPVLATLQRIQAGVQGAADDVSLAAGL
jgi:hypothetical protein